MLSMGALLEIAGVLTSVMALESYLTLGDKAPHLEVYKRSLIPNKFLRDKINSGYPFRGSYGRQCFGKAV